MRTLAETYTLAYLDFLKANRLLEHAMAGTLPKPIEEAARKYVISSVRRNMSPLEKDGMAITKDYNIACSSEEQDKVNELIDDYIQHYNLAKLEERLILASQVREFEKGKKYIVKSGFFEGACVLLKGLDSDVWGQKWLEAFNNPAAEKFLFRAQRDDLPVKGRFYVCKHPRENRDILLHESELGEMVQ